MANRLIRSNVCGLCATAIACCSLPAAAQSALADPTRPPVGVFAAPANPAEAAGPVLQSVLIPEKGKPVAVIGGQPVRLGERYGESRLIRLTDREAILDGPNGRTRLLLTPGIEKTHIITKNPSKSPAARQAQSGDKP